MKIVKHDIEISNKDKVLFPESQFTKMDLIKYYKNVGELMLPHLKDRPLMMQRFPDGIATDGFYQKQAADYFPKWIETIEVDKEDGKIEHVVCNNLSTLIYLVNQGVITFHTWLSKTNHLKNPDKFIIDLDPPTDDFELVRKGAKAIKKLLDKLKVTSFLKVTGSKGLHIIIPLNAKCSFEKSKTFGKDLTNILTGDNPEIFTTSARKDKRDNKLYLDILRNAYAQTAVAPFSLRARELAPIALPIDWEELNKKKLNASKFQIENINNRLSKKVNPWKGMMRHAVSIENLHKKLLH